MRRFGQFLGRAAHRQPHDKQRLNATRPSAWLSARFEPLEQRQLLAANILASLQGNLASPSDVHYLQLTVNGGQSALIGLRMQGTGGSVDPDSMRVETLAGHTIAPVLSQADGAHGNDSVLLVDLAPGSYSVITKAENGTTGAYQVDVFLVGDLSGDGAVDDHETLWASGAVVQHMGTANYVTRLFYQSKGIDLSKDLYRTEIDTDFDGDCDSDDLGRINRNKGVCGISAELVGDAEAPAIQAALVNDTGRSATDGITSALAIAGTIHDDREIVAFRAGLDGMNPAAYVSVLAEVDAGGHFLFDQARLEAILGGSVANNGPHTLHLVAEDDLGNASATPYNVTFTLDTIAPAAPTGLDLLASSDRGFYDNDDVTADNTPTILVEAETSALVRLSSSIDGYVGQAIVASPVSITTPTLSDGDHDFTATATDLAGNTSGVSAPLSVLIETVAPVVPTLDLAAASDTGTLGDRLTSLVSVTLVGLAEAQSRMTLTNTGASVMAGATGAFSIGAVPLSFGNNLLTVTSMDLAGNTSSFTQTIKQNNVPTAGAYGPIAVDEDPGAKTYDLVGVFTDVNLVAGDTLTLSIIGNTNPSLVTPSLTGTSGQVTNNSLRLTFGQDRNGTATITVRATDAAGEYADATIVVNVAPVNDAPVPEDTSVVHVEENQSVDVDLRTRFKDVETADDNLVFQLVSPTGQFGLGTAEILADGHTLRFTPNTNVNGLDYVQVRVTDTGEGTSAAKTITGTVIFSIDPFNDPPQANTTTLVTDEDVAVQVDLWTLTSDTETADANLSYALAGAAHGSVQLVDGHIARFTPAADYNGPASFTYTVTDTGDGTSPAKSTGPVTISVTVNPVNDTPVALPTTLTTAEDTAVTVDLRTLVTDVETADDALIFTVAGATHGTVELIDGHTARFTPTGEYNGPASFTYSVQDTGDGAAAKTVGPISIGV
ncbi:MAG: Ig-like domain-containing protein, partial [Planctomycetia bacterium]|nr:Ig-like domain-containing protein [Planctomycetia bacterium]